MLRRRRPERRVDRLNQGDWLPGAIAQVRQLTDEIIAIEAETARLKAQRKAGPQKRPRPVVPVDALQKEALVINQLLNESYGIPAKVPWKRSPDSIQLTPQHRLYRLEQIKPYRMDDLIGRLDDMGRHIKSMSRDNRGGDVSVSIVPTQPPWLQVTRPDPQKHLWRDRARELSPLVATIGDWWKGAERVAATIDMYGEQARHNCGLFCGGQGSGKTSMLRRSLLSLMENNGPDALHVYIIETKSGKSFADFAGLPHIKGIATTVEDALDVVKLFDHWCKPEGNPDDGVYRLLVFDEFHDALEDETHGEKIYGAVKRVMAKGRSLDIRVWVATQIPDRDSFPPRLKALVQFMVIGRVDNDSYLRSQLHVHGANRLEKLREFLFVDCGVQTVVTTHWLPDREMAGEIGRIRGGYGVDMGVDIGVPKVDITVPEAGYIRPEGRIYPDMAPATRVSDDLSPRFPLGFFRQLTDVEAQAVSDMYAEGATVRKITVDVFGSRDPKRYGEIKRVLGLE